MTIVLGIIFLGLVFATFAATRLIFRRTDRNIETAKQKTEAMIETFREHEKKIKLLLERSDALQYKFDRAKEGY